MIKNKKAFSLIEALLAMVFIAAIAAISIPRINFASIHRQKGDTVARKIATDLRKVRRMAISDAATNSTGYMIRFSGSGSYTSYSIYDLSNFSQVETLEIPDEVTCTGGGVFAFGPMGNLFAGSTNPITVSSEGKSYTITITTATGMITCSE